MYIVKRLIFSALVSSFNLFMKMTDKAALTHVAALTVAAR